ncbi:MAG: 3'(2'),5'-bisphosphate nucleotidase CysQ [Deltaproteobacteria bacterium]|nr:3'(2'),5'-bisphosphate nucleotidase CysQ [Deltaproteobacteria bacterium]MBW2068928.1 3'(2'),5'-bisphosphate nucleotidase CysQ [Deltaproteobacteria bacterium]
MRINLNETFFVELSRKLRKVILEYYKGTYSTSFKEDKSPLTEADLHSHRIIKEALGNYFPNIPVLSEEGKEIPYEERLRWEYFWVVDPLDGTKEFINSADEFTVNIGLVRRNRPVFGFVYVPVFNRLYLGYGDRGALRIDNERRKVLKTAKIPTNRRLKVAISRFHLDEITRRFLEDFSDCCEPVVRGSALKFCSVAEGDVDFYLRFGPTWEWDTAAGQAVVEAAGGAVINVTGSPLEYNKETLKNGPFIVVPDREWFLASSFWEWIRKTVVTS